MKFNELTISKQKNPKRVGRGISAGGGKTAGRGTKGQGARKSGGVRVGFEGGQMPLYMRIPKLRGFKSHRTVAEEIYTGQLDGLKRNTVDTNTLFEAGLITSPYNHVKLLLKGDISTKKTVKLSSASTAAIKAVEKAGGTFKKVERLARASKKSST